MFRYNAYDLSAYIDSSCSVYFGKRALFPEFMWKKAKNSLQVRIVDNSIMSRNEAIEGLNIEIKNRRSPIRNTSSMGY